MFGKRKATYEDQMKAKDLAREGDSALIPLLKSLNFENGRSLCEIAAQHGHIHLVQWFVDHQPSMVKAQSLHTAAYHGHVDLVQMLIPFCDAEDVKQSLRYVIAAPHNETSVSQKMIDLLFPHCDHAGLLNDLLEYPQMSLKEEHQYLQQKSLALQQKAVLLDAVCVYSNPSTSKKSKI